ncbi:MAG: secondary thiamine-phosphate synthase enzyme YjbQ [Gammaproteobacteria bacterium]|jgi:secondary thiamine-phosphate synthase enzyme
MIVQKEVDVMTEGRGTYDITQKIQQAVRQSGIDTGLCHVFIRHTSASVILCENADPEVRNDLERYMAKYVPDGDDIFRHNMEGPDDMPAHIRTILTQSNLTLPVRRGQCSLGTWQGIYLWEHRTSGFLRRLTVTIQG